ncbi:MAG: RDD family protein [Tissierellia bacterium]|nr:RDD family protein [Tissierellia bacterium]
MREHYDPFKADKKNKKTPPEELAREERTPVNEPMEGGNSGAQNLTSQGAVQEAPPAGEMAPQGSLPEDASTAQGPPLDPSPRDPERVPKDPERVPKDPFLEAGEEHKRGHAPYEPPRVNHREVVTPFISAGFWIRGVALLFDLVVAFAFARIFTAPLVALLPGIPGWLEKIISGIFFYGYFVGASLITNGQSLGKMLMGLRVIHSSHRPMDFTTAFIREGASRLILNTFPILYLISAFTPTKQGIGDMLSDTYVVHDKLYAVERDHPKVFHPYL